MNTATDQTKTQYAEAREEFSGDWDENGTVSAHLPRRAAVEFLLANGWVHTERATQRGGLYWYNPAADVECWEIQEALELTIVALSK